MKYLFTGLLSLFLITSIQAQQSERLHTITSQSEVMEEERTLKIYLPEDYSDHKKYPVIYITDGATDNFEVAANYLDGLSKPFYNLIPQSILVGIHHNVRNDDLDVHDSESGKIFMKYLHEEAVPYMDSTYSTSGFNAMIGHSNGAEYNHFLMMDENNPFRGFISMSTSFNTDVRDRLADFFNSYEGKNMYYFIANATFDSPERPQYGNEFAEIFEANPNPNVHLTSKTYKANHTSIVPVSLYDGLRFVFKDYYAIDTYDTFTEYRENYLTGLKQNYGLDGAYKQSDLENYLLDIMMNKKLDEFQRFLELEAEQKVFMGKGLDPVNIANQYHFMGAHDKTIEYFNDALDNYDSYSEKYPEHFVNMYGSMLRIAIRSYESLGNIDELITFLARSSEKVSERRSFFVNYKIAQLSVEHDTSPDKGLEAIAYCRDNYIDNNSISMNDILALEEKISEMDADSFGTDK